MLHLKAMTDTLLSNILFKTNRRRVLGLLLLHPEQGYHVREIARLTSTAAGTINKELRKLAEAGLLRQKRQGNQLLYQADTDSVIFEELAGILRKTSGLAEVLAEALLPLSEMIDVAFVFGSIASGKANNNSDIDICIIGEVAFGDAVRALYDSQVVLQREINAKCYSSSEWDALKIKPTAFFKQLLDKPVINIIGNRDDIRKSGRP